MFTFNSVIRKNFSVADNSHYTVSCICLILMLLRFSQIQRLFLKTNNSTMYMYCKYNNYFIKIIIIIKDVNKMLNSTNCIFYQVKANWTFKFSLIHSVSSSAIEVAANCCGGPNLDMVFRNNTLWLTSLEGFL